MKIYEFPNYLTEYFHNNGDSSTDIFNLMKKMVDDNPDKYYMKWDNISILLIERGMEEYYPKIDSFMNPYYGEYIKVNSEWEHSNLRR